MSLSNAQGSPEMHALWERISAHPFVDPECRLDFVGKLMQLQGWTRPQALLAIEEYRRFCFLACVDGTFAAPSDQVDQVWHLHLTYTRDYWDVWCTQVLRVPLHHQPSRGGGEDLARHRYHYAETLARYERWFGAPPESLWPGTHERFRRPQRFQHVDLETVWVLPRPQWPSRVSVALTAALTGLASTASALAIEGTVLNWDGRSFLKLFMLLFLASVVVAFFWRRYLRENGARENAAALAPLEVAYLVGGPTRCFDTAIAELLRQEVIAFDKVGEKFVFVKESPALSPPLAGLSRIIRNEGRVDQALKLGSHAFDEIRSKLQRLGLLLDPDQARRIAWKTAALPGAVLLLGLLKIGIGIERGRPVLFLVMISLLVLVATLVFLLRTPTRSRAGDRSIADLRRIHARAARAPRDMELPIAVALLGTVAMSSTAWAGYHELRAPPSASSSTTSSTTDSSSSCGDSSSDSGGGGGGCGGCGGGGGGD